MLWTSSNPYHNLSRHAQRNSANRQSSRHSNYTVCYISRLRLMAAKAVPECVSGGVIAWRLSINDHDGSPICSIEFRDPARPTNTFITTLDLVDNTERFAQTVLTECSSSEHVA